MNINFNDFYKSESKGFGLSTGGGTTSDSGKQSLAPSGSTTMSVKSTGEEREQITRATIGNGTITTGVQSYTKELDENGNETGKLISVDGKTLDNNDPTIAGLNRDVNNSQEITKDMITGALDGSMTIDNRILGLLVGNTNGVKSIAKDFKDLGKNIKQIGSGLRNNIITKSIENSFKDSETSLIQAVKDYIRDDGKIAEIQKNKKLTAEQNGLTNLDAEGVQNSLQQLADIAGKDGGFEGNVDLYNIDGQTKGYAYTNGNGEDNKNNNTIGFNTGTNNLTNSGETVNTIFHETTNLERHDKNERTAENRGNTAEAIWNLKNFGNQNTNSQANIDSKGQLWNQQNSNSPVITQGNVNRITNYANYYQQNVVNGNNSVKLDELTIYIHGTAIGAKPEILGENHPLIKSISKTFGEDVIEMMWSGGNTKEARSEAALKLKEIIGNHNFAEGELLNLVMHSHGGNAGKEYTNLEDSKMVDYFITLATPNVSGHQANLDKIGVYLNVYDTRDWAIQGGASFLNFGKPLINGIPSKSTEKIGAINVPVTQIENKSILNYTSTDITILILTGQKAIKGIGPFDAHTKIKSSDVWNKAVIPALNNKDQLDRKPVIILNK